MPKIFPVVVKRTTINVSDATPTATFNESVDLADPVVNVMTLSGEGVELDDPLINALALESDGAFLGDGFDVPDVSADVPDTVEPADANAVTFVWTPSVAELGSGTGVMWQDAWTDSSSANANHVTDGGLAVQHTGLGASKEAYYEFDLTKFSGFVADGDSTLRVVYTNSNVGAVSNMTVNYSTSASQIFNEATLTDNNKPNVATFLSNITYAQGTNQVANLTIPEAAVNAMLGKWVAIRFFTTGSQLNAIQVFGKDAIAALRPTLTLNLIR